MWWILIDIKTAAKQVSLYFIRRTTRPRYQTQKYPSIIPALEIRITPPGVLSFCKYPYNYPIRIVRKLDFLLSSFKGTQWLFSVKFLSGEADIA